MSTFADNTLHSTTQPEGSMKEPAGMKEPADGEQEPSKPQVRLTDLEIDNEVTALNVMVQFLGLAQKRGAFTIDESAKIWECVKKFQRPDLQK